MNTIDNDIQKYFKSVRVFDRYNNNVKPSVYFLGLSGEVGELCGALINSKYPLVEDQQILEKIKDEIGDIIWYWVALANILGIDYKCIWDTSFPAYNDNNEILRLVSNVGRLSEHLKKSIRDDNGKITKHRLGNIEKYMAYTLDSLFVFCKTMGFKPSSILQLNYNKLFARHISGTLQGEGDGINGTGRTGNV